MINYLEPRRKVCNDEEGAILLSQGKGNNFIEIEKLSEPTKRADGKRVSYMMRYRELSVVCENETDEAWCCVKFEDISYWAKGELHKFGIKPSNKTKYSDGYSIFDNISLF